MRTALVLAVVLLGGLVSGCERAPQTAKQGDRTLSGKGAACNVLLLTLDTTRADRLGCYGWANAVTPALDALAKCGVRFEQAFAQVPLTLPSHASIVTGAYPPEHAVRENGIHKLGPDLPTLAESFGDHGYRTGAFLASIVLDARHGLDRGFEIYDAKPIKDSSGHTRSRKPADVVCDQALHWLERVKDERFLAWVHFYDPHAPYLAPAEFVRQVGDPYDAEVAFMDANIQRLLDWLKDNNLTQKTLVVAVGDHGESLGEHGYQEHSLLVYDSTIQVPMIFSLPGVLPAGATHAGITRTVDVMPTILDVLGWEVPDEVSGVSLLAALDGRELAPLTSYGETYSPFVSFGWSKLHCLVEERWKYIRAPVVALYDRQADPGELENLAERYPAEVERMEAALFALEESMSVRETVVQAVDAEAHEALQSLGYVGSAGPTDDSGDLRNPVDMVQVADDFWEAMGLVQGNKLAEGIALLESAYARSPESFVIVELLGKAYGMAGRLDESQQKLMEAIAIHPDSADAYEALAQAFGMQGHYDKALEACKKALELDPDHPRAKPLLARLRSLTNGG